MCMAIRPLLGDPSHPNYIADLIVVGGVLADGQYTIYASQGDFIDVYAPSREIKVPDPAAKYTGPDSYDEGHGTSLAAPTVAGLALYLRALDPSLTTAALTKARILQLAYVRPPRQGESPFLYYQPVIWNGQPLPEEVDDRVCIVMRKLKGRQTAPAMCPVNVPPSAIRRSVQPRRAVTHMRIIGGLRQVLPGLFLSR